MTVRRTPLLLLAGSWVALLLVGLLGLTTTPSIALADGSGGDTIQLPPVDTTGKNNARGGDGESDSDELSTLELFIDLMYVLL
jgi:hypothetical protein